MDPSDVSRLEAEIQLELSNSQAPEHRQAVADQYLPELQRIINRANSALAENAEAEAIWEDHFLTRVTDQELVEAHNRADILRDALAGLSTSALLERARGTTDRVSALAYYSVIEQRTPAPTDRPAGPDRIAAKPVLDALEGVIRGRAPLSLDQRREAARAREAKTRAQRLMAKLAPRAELDRARYNLF